MMTKSALIVDDSATMRNMIKATVAELGFEIDTAQDGEKAFTQAKKKSYDIVITDINMPNVDGIELIRMLRESETCKYAPILVISTEAGDNVKQAGKQAGASGWIVKPFDPETLTKAVSKLCGL